MSTDGPGPKGGSRATVKKRAQRKRKTGISQARPVQAPKPVLTPEDPNLKKLTDLAYEATIIATQARKYANSYGKGLPVSHDAIRDITRANKILYGLMRENTERLEYDRRSA